MGRMAMKRPAKARVKRDLVEWLDSLPPRRRNLLKKTAINAERIRKASHG